MHQICIIKGSYKQHQVVSNSNESLNEILYKLAFFLFEHFVLWHKSLDLKGLDLCCVSMCNLQGIPNFLGYCTIGNMFIFIWSEWVYNDPFDFRNK